MTGQRWGTPPARPCEGSAVTLPPLADDRRSRRFADGYDRVFAEVERSFLGPIRSVNVWLALSRCGDVAPSMDVIPKRFEGMVETGTEGAVLDYQVAQAMAEQVAGDAGIVRPIFDPGDALLFDHLFLHQTGSDPAMPNPRYAIESWFFGPSAYPVEYAPIAF